MRTKSKFWMIALVFLSFMAILSPHHAHAQTAGPDLDCSSGNAFDKSVDQNRSAYQQEAFNLAHNVGSLFPIQNALNECVQNVMSAFQALPGLGNPIGAIISSLLTNLLTSVINSACSQIMGTITSVQQSIVNLTKICLPMPSFGSLDLPQFNAPACSGGITFSPLTSFSPVNRPTYSYSNYQGRPY